MGRPVLPGGPGGGVWKIGQFQYLNALGKPIYLLQPERQNKSQARLIYLFLNTPVYADPGYFDSVLIWPDVNEKDVIRNNGQYDDGQEDLQAAGQPEIKFG